MYLLWIILSFSAIANGNKFPEYFKFGVATASYQIEGGWNEDGKGLSIWDEYTHKQPEMMADRSNGDVAASSYHFYKRDIQMLKELGVHFYRFSLSWSRLLPSGFPDKINEHGYKYYSNLIDELLAEGIEPYVTLFHWDLPQKLQDLGGWQNDAIVQYFVDYAFVAFSLFGDRVKNWVTHNELKVVCDEGYGSVDKAPGANSTGVGNYMCMHNLLKSHARAYHLYKKVFWEKQRGKIGIAAQVDWQEAESDSYIDKLAADDALEFHIGRIFDPIIFGHYPKLVENYVEQKSKEQGFPRSRLPTFSDHEKSYMKNTLDFLAVNYYTAITVSRDGSEDNKYAVPSLQHDTAVSWGADPSWDKAASSWLYVTPWALRKTFNWLKNRYGNYEMMVLENGFSTIGGLDDDDRINYMNIHLETVLASIKEDKCNVTTYAFWSLMDNFEWNEGYTEKFGLYEVDFNHPNRTRTPRKSAKVYANIIKTREIENDSLTLEQV